MTIDSSWDARIHAVLVAMVAVTGPTLILSRMMTMRMMMMRIRRMLFLRFLFASIRILSPLLLSCPVPSKESNELVDPSLAEDRHTELS